MPSEERKRCVGCRYHTRDEMCMKFTDRQTDTYAYAVLCRGDYYTLRKQSGNRGRTE